MSLHKTTEIVKKIAIVLALTLGSYLFITFSIKIGSFIHSVLFPPKIPAPNQAYGKIPQLVFPHSTVKGQFSYTINTVNGSLPDNFPDRIIVYPMIVNQPNLLNLNTTKTKIASLGFVDSSGNPLTEIPRGGPNYEWDEQGSLHRKIIYDIVSQDFTMTSNFLTSLTVLSAQSLGDQNTAIATVQDFLGSVNSFPPDVDLSLTQNPNPDNTYNTMPQLYSIQNGQLSSTTSLSSAQVIRVDLYQKEVDYAITAAEYQNPTQALEFDMKIPVLYPHPPYSTMNFLVASGDNSPAVVSAIFNYQQINFQPARQATYPIKTAQQAFDDLKNGKGYIASYNGNASQISITKVYVAYYIGQTLQNYLMPVVVFEGDNGFYAYVNALSDETLK